MFVCIMIRKKWGVLHGLFGVACFLIGSKRILYLVVVNCEAYMKRQRLKKIHQ